CALGYGFIWVVTLDVW
nr:immunoglobulin heavy chain junction region [Macaca mulatta]MOY23221.1 immunoglobulin heavy chain junction region [Macaca mulatta]MOY25460.1 immunoglobulin heavy chain junction region [Macaca mulatta]MOY29736.1 immunoglobulin heavy chain junction region [Macaca mulatta]